MGEFPAPSEAERWCGGRSEVAGEIAAARDAAAR